MLIRAVNFVILRNYRSFFLICAKEEFLIGSKLKEDIIVVEFINEDTTERFLHFFVFSNFPLVAPNSSCRTIKAEIKRNIGCSCAIVNYDEVKLLVLASYIVKVEAIPGLACRNLSSFPIEVKRFSISVIYNVVSLKHFS